MLSQEYAFSFFSFHSQVPSWQGGQELEMSINTSQRKPLHGISWEQEELEEGRDTLVPQASPEVLNKGLRRTIWGGLSLVEQLWKNPTVRRRNMSMRMWMASWSTSSRLDSRCLKLTEEWVIRIGSCERRCKPPWKKTEEERRGGSRGRKTRRTTWSVHSHNMIQIPIINVLVLFLWSAPLSPFLLQLCFNCRKPGHGLADCPEADRDEEMGRGICYRCGSTEHEIQKCRAKVDPALGENSVNVHRRLPALDK